jgi:RNA polymerase sigma-70 factor (ECF subfamily)
MPPTFPGSGVLPLLSIAPADPHSDSREKLHEEIAVVFDQLRDPLLRYLWSFGLEIQDRQEVLQDAFLSLFRHLDRGKPIDNVRGWLFRVAHNLALKRRYQTRREGGSQLETGSGDKTVDPSPNPEDQFAIRQARERVGAVVEALTEQDRRCLFLRAEGLRYREIGEILGMSLGAVSLSITRTLARIARSTDSQRGSRATER